MLENADLSQPKLVTGFCQLVKLLQQGQRELKLDNFFSFLEITFIYFILLLKIVQALEQNSPSSG